MKKIKYFYRVGDNDYFKIIPHSAENEKIAKMEAFDGVYAIEDDGKEEETQQPLDERIAELEEALDMLLSGVTE